MKKLFALTALVLAGCPPQLPPETKPTSEPDPVLEPGLDPEDAACKRYEELKCQSRDGRNLWEPTPGGATCVQVFENAKANGVDLHPACIAKMATCEERDACTAKE